MVFNRDSKFAKILHIAGLPFYTFLQYLPSSSVPPKGRAVGGTLTTGPNMRLQDYIS
jgi:hypothetical protein